MVQTLWKTVWWFLKTLNLELLFDAAILLLGMYQKGIEKRDMNRYLYTQVHSIFHGSQKVETTQVSIHK